MGETYWRDYEFAFVIGGVLLLAVRWSGAQLYTDFYNWNQGLDKYIYFKIFIFAIGGPLSLMDPLCKKCDLKPFLKP